MPIPGGDLMANRWWILKTGGLFLAIGIAAVVLAAEPFPVAPVTPAAVTSCEQPMNAPTALAVDDAVDPTAACRMRPECDVDEDCDALCGTGLGHCVHNRCPIRICRCG